MEHLLAPPESDMNVPLPEPGQEWHHHTIHTHYFSFCVPEVALGAYIYIRYHPTFPLCHGGVYLFEGFDNLQPLDVAHCNYEVTMPWPSIEDKTITTDNGLRVEFLEPGRRVRISYDSGDGDAAFEMEQVAIGPLLTRAHAMPGESDHHGNPLRAPGGTEQCMRATGNVTIRGETHEIDCYAPRDRTWSQVRTERRNAVRMPPLGWSPFAFGPDLIFNQLGFEAPDTNPRWLGVCDVPPDRPSHVFARIIVDGEPREIVRVRRDALEYHPDFHIASHQRIEAEDDTGRRYQFTGEAIAIANLPAWPNLAFHDAVYRWRDGETGRVTHCSYQEMWFEDYQRAIKSRRARRPPAGIAT
jgi:hypothetical protein